MEIRKTAVVTGSTGAIGKAIVRKLLQHGGYRVIMIARDEQKALQVVEELKRKNNLEVPEYLIADLSEKKQIDRIASLISGPVHVLVNNAAITPVRRLETGEGLEMQFAVNVLGYFRLIEVMLPQLKSASSSRVINVASYWAGGLDLGDLQFTRRPYDNDSAYRQSKQANRMLTVAHAERLRQFGISVNACHPGDVNSALSNSMGFGGHESPDQGADTPVWLATSEAAEGVTGKYFEHRKQLPCRFGQDRLNVEKLYEECYRVISPLI